MAAQYEVIFSSEVTGVGIVAGGPYYCTKGSLLRAALCTTSPVTLVSSLKSDVDELAAKPAEFFAEGLIDDPANIKRHKVYMFSGTLDFVVNSGVMTATRDIYLKYGVSAANLLTKFDLSAGHGECIV
jgi:hypothetical protein